MRFERGSAARQSVLTVDEQLPPLKVVRAFPAAGGAALVHLHNVSGGVLGGDSLELDVELGPGARAQLTTTGATRVYRSGAGGTSVQTTDARVGEGALLEYLPDPLIPFAGARYRQETRVALSDGAGLFLWETVAPGRAASGELFEYDRLCLDLRVTAGGRPIAVERARLEPRVAPLTSPARLGRYRYFATFLACRAGAPPARWRELEQELADVAANLSRPGEAVWGASALPAHGIVARALSRRGRDIAPGLLALWAAAKRALYGEETTPPRKVY